MNYPRLSRGEYWLLNLVVNHSYPIHWLDATNPGELFNRDGHGMSRQELLETLESMFSNKWIEAHIPFLDCQGSEQIDRALLDEILEGRGPKYQHDRSLYYRLTSIGGSIWEAFAQPRWIDYIYPVFVVDAGETGEIIGATEYRVRTYFSLIHLERMTAVSDSATWDIVSPWQCTYWKTLPQGHRVRFVCQERKIQDPSPRSERELFEWLKKWYEWD